MAKSASNTAQMMMANSLKNKNQRSSLSEQKNETIENEKKVVHPNQDNNVPLEKNKNVIYYTKDYNMFQSYPKAELRLELHTGLQREQLKNSIDAHGITSPIKVTPNGNDKYVVLSGHNRLDIAKELGIEVPYIILKDLSEKTQDEIVAEEHLLNRQQSDFKPSQMLKLLQTIKNTSESQEDLLKKSVLGKTQTYKVLKLANLNPNILLNLVDTNKITMVLGESISKHSSQNQEFLYEYIVSKGIEKIPSKAIRDLNLYTYEEWNTELLDNIFDLRKVEKSTTNVQIAKDIIKDIENPDIVITKLLEKYLRGEINLD